MSDQLSSDLASLHIDRGSPSRQRPSGSGSIGKFLLIACTIGGGVALSVVAYNRYSTQLFKQEVRTTEVVLLSPSQAEVQVTATGYVIPQRTSKVGSKLAGRLKEVLVKEGDTVKEGDVIARLEDADSRTQLRSMSARAATAQARVNTARANLAEVSQEVERERQLNASGTTGKASLDKLEARQRALKSMVKAAEAERAAAQADVGTESVGLKDHLIVAPIPGKIVSKPAAAGEVVGGLANPTPIAEIVDLQSMMVEADVPEARVHMIKLGTPCEIVLDANPGKRYRGEAAELGQRVNRSKATIVVKVKFTDKFDDVLPDMSARVSFLSKPIADDAVNEKPKQVVANDAIADRNGQKVLFAIEGGKLHAVPVKVGPPVGGTSVELLDGPPPGTKVVAQPTASTADGQQVKEEEPK